MELRLLDLALSLLDPRKWRLRLAQLGGGILAALWIWFRAVDNVEVDRALRDARRQLRRERIAERNVALERARLAP